MVDIMPAQHNGHLSRRCLFVLQRSLHDSNHNICNHSFNTGYGLEILRAAPSKRLNCTMKRSVMEAGEGLNHASIRLRPTTTLSHTRLLLSISILLLRITI